MTTIVGVEDQGVAWLAGDSMVDADASEVQLVRGGKLFRFGCCVVGACGDVAFDNVLRYGVKWPSKPPSSLSRWIYTQLAPALSKSKADGGALIGIAGKLWAVDTEGEVFRPLEKYTAIGSGAGAALIGLSLTVGEPIRDRLRRVMASVAKHTVHAREPFTILSTKVC